MSSVGFLRMGQATAVLKLDATEPVESEQLIKDKMCGPSSLEYLLLLNNFRFSGRLSPLALAL